VRYDDGSFLHAELARDGATGFAVSESADAAIPTTGRNLGVTPPQSGTYCEYMAWRSAELGGATVFSAAA